CAFPSLRSADRGAQITGNRLPAAEEHTPLYASYRLGIGLCSVRTCFNGSADGCVGREFCATQSKLCLSLSIMRGSSCPQLACFLCQSGYPSFSRCTFKSNFCACAIASCSSSLTG